ncbi:TfoX/Sxy family DNA transformation protein [Nocardia sp. IBHARD005]|uniref:TfoX/Sxy family DNA transformation protein n=1 Tax=Nocardia sp. IBHARD005 TaxID=3457765 RepID=UPI004059F59A
MLAHADVHSLDDLAELGAVRAYRRLRAAGVKGLNLEMLWALEGALTYRHRRWISSGRRREMIAELGAAPASAPARRRRRYRAPVRSSHGVTVGARH